MKDSCICIDKSFHIRIKKPLITIELDSYQDEFVNS